MMSGNFPESEERNIELNINSTQNDSPNQPITLDVEVPSEDLVDRMANAFDKNLDSLINDIQNPPPPPPIKLKKPKKPKQVKIKKVKFNYGKYKPITGGKDPSFNAFVGRKVMSAFSLAATARRNAKQMGAEQKPRGFFLKKALGFEFGGDFINRSLGTLSNDPTEERDPSLSKGQRFGAMINNVIQPSEQKVTPQSSTTGSPYTQPSLFDTNKYTSVSNNSLTDQIKRALKKLESSYDRVSDLLGKSKQSKNKSTQINEQELSVVETLSNKFVTVKESIKENNILKKSLSKIKQLQLNVQKKIVDDRELAAQEASLEQGKDLSGNVSYTDPYAKTTGKKSIFSKVVDFITGDDYDLGEDDGGGPNIDIDLPDRDRRRRPGSRRRLLRRKLGTKFTQPFKKSGQQEIQKGLEKGSQKALQKGASEVGEKTLEKGAKKGIGKLLGKTAGKLVPGVGAAIGIAEGTYRISQGDVLGGLLSFGSAIPILGWGFTAVDVARELRGSDDKNKKLSEGGVAAGGVPAMVGEAGPELITSATNPLAMTPMLNPAMSSVGVILGTTKKIVQDAGPSAASVKPFIEQIIGPLAKTFGAPSYAMTTDVGKNLSNVREPKADGGILGFLKKIIKFVTGNEEDSGGGSSEATTTSSAASDAGAYKDLLDMIAGVESTSSGGYEAFNRGGSAGGTVAHGSGNSAEVAIGGVVKPLSQRTVAEVMRLQAAGELHATGRYQIIQSTLSGLMNGNYGDTGVKPTDLYDAVTQDKLGIALIKYRLKTGATPSNFRSEWVGLQKVPDDKLSAAINNANVAYQANPNATAVSTPSGGTSSPPSQTAQGSTPSAARPTRAVGDSIAQGVSDASRGAAADHATPGDNPNAVLSKLKSAGISRGNTSSVVLSTGLSNDPSMKQQALQQMQYLQSKGIPFTVLPVSEQISKRNGNLNSWLSGAANQSGGSFASGASFSSPSSDDTQAHPSSYLPMVQSLRLANN
jgi:hypothetical protein